ncbi:MAG TPA: hypothetical protein VHO02_04250 [Fibrobacteria bacterium]|nr:hypothetical protein [Fibrobacteria bacterium]
MTFLRAHLSAPQIAALCAFVAAPLVVSLPAPLHAQEADPEAAILLARAKRNQFSGDFSATATCVRESYLGGRDTLRGVFESTPSRGERRLVLEGGGRRFEWWSRLNGGEQWRREDLQGRLRRVPPRSLKKPALARDVSFDDLTHFPFGYLEDFRSARKAEGDAYALRLAPGGAFAPLYASMQAEFERDPVRLRRILFAGNPGRPSKHMEITRYGAAKGGYFPEEIVFAGDDGLSRITLSLALSAGRPAGDNTRARDEIPRGFAEPKWLPRGEE